MKTLLPHSLTLLLAILLASQPGGSRAQTRQPKSRALLVGISKYEGPGVPPTQGAEEDALETAQFIKKRYGFLDGDIEVLTQERATAQNIISKFQTWLIDGTKPGDRVFFLYAGHGAQLPDDNNDEDDKLDETLAPYDVKLNGDNMIRDDQLERLIAQLSGRFAVLLFDSCHSGTISRSLSSGPNKTAAGSTARYLPSQEQLNRLAASGNRSAGEPVAYEVSNLEGDSRILQTRDLKLVNSKSVGPTAGIIVISAAQSGQIAFSMDVGGGRQRGALSYVFSQEAASNPRLGELENRVTERIKLLQDSKTLSGTQIPAFEVNSTVPLKALPLFGDGPTTPEIALANPHSTVKLSLSTRDGKTIYRFGDKVAYRIHADRPGYLYLLVFSEQDKVTRLFPNEEDRDNFVKTGPYSFPRDESHSFKVGPPEGKDIVVALLSASKLNLEDRPDNEPYTWGEIFERLKEKRFSEYVRLRSQVVEKNKPAGLTDWQASSLVLTIVK